MAAMPNVGGAPKASPAAGGGVDPKVQGEILAAYKAIDKTFDKMAEAAPALKEGLEGVKQSLSGVISGKLNIDPKMLESEAAPGAVPDNKSPQEPSAPPPGNKSPQEVPVPA